MEELVEARDVLNSEFWQTNLNSLPASIVQFYDEISSHLSTGTTFAQEAYRNMTFISSSSYSDTYMALYQFPYCLFMLLDFFSDLSHELEHEIDINVYSPKTDLSFRFQECWSETSSLRDSCGCESYTAIVNITRGFSFMFNKMIVLWDQICVNNISYCTEETSRYELHFNIY